jgi:hypothetical protein
VRGIFSNYSDSLLNRHSSDERPDLPGGNWTALYSARGCENASLHNRKKLSPRPGLCCLAKRTSSVAGGLGGSGVWAVQVKLHAASAKITRQSNLMSASIVDRMPTIEARLIDSRRPMYRNPSMDRKEYKSRAIPPVVLHILLALSERALHGYGIIRG